MWKLGLRPRNSQKKNTEMGFFAVWFSPLAAEFSCRWQMYSLWRIKGLYSVVVYLQRTKTSARSTITPQFYFFMIIPRYGMLTTLPHAYNCVLYGYLFITVEQVQHIFINFSKHIISRVYEVC
jgi:hypothetical protein